MFGFLFTVQSPTNAEITAVACEPVSPPSPTSRTLRRRRQPGSGWAKASGSRRSTISTISSYPLNRHLKQLARDNGIPFQMEILTRGGTDAGAMQRATGGRPVTTLSIPVRYAHTVNEICSPADVQATIDLLRFFLEHAHESDYQERD
ncbi:MAG: hypothetical protein R3A46_10355 [Thermomicrobiales bacterium]